MTSSRGQAANTLIRDFAMRGLVVIPPAELGVPQALHNAIFEAERSLFASKQRPSAANIPQILQVLSAPGLVAACNQLIGEHWAIVPYTHNTPFVSGAMDQHWHKDDNGPFNGRKQRHHQAVQIEMLYYPQAVAEDMGPTATIPGSHYWTFNHEENHDNFAGADHLDFGYQLNGMERVPVSGPKSDYDRDDIVHRRTPHDVRMRDAVSNTGWPLMAPWEAAPLAAGSVVLYSHNLFHRGNHRRDDWQTWRDNPRFMWRFWLYRTTEPAPGEEPAFLAPGTDPLTGVDLGVADANVTTVWQQQQRWLHTGRHVINNHRDEDIGQLADQLEAIGEAAEPARVGAAYRLAEARTRHLALGVLAAGIESERESVRRAATWGLIATGDAATPVLLAAAESPLKWVRKAAMQGLGDAAMLTDTVHYAASVRLASDTSVAVRSVAASALGCLARRAIGTGRGKALVPDCAAALVACLGREENRLSMDRAQGRSIKFVRPTDDCDVCEGIGITYGFDRFDPVRSAPRENALWSLVILCSHGETILGQALPAVIEALAVVAEQDRNLFAVGFALDALHRLARLPEPGAHAAAIAVRLDGLEQALPLLCAESRSRSGAD